MSLPTCWAVRWAGPSWQRGDVSLRDSVLDESSVLAGQRVKASEAGLAFPTPEKTTQKHHLKLSTALNLHKRAV